MGLSKKRSEALSPGQTAPEFKLIDQAGKTHRLSDYRQHWLVLYFYPKDDTPGCTREACNFRDDISALRALDVAVLGISLDNQRSHARFAEKYKLPFPLLSDSDGTAAKAYHAYWSFGPLKFSKRHTFIIDPEGRLVKIYHKIKPDGHSAQVIRDLKAFKNQTTTKE